jgi:hypothetical protein
MLSFATRISAIWQHCSSLHDSPKKDKAVSEALPTVKHGQPGEIYIQGRGAINF